MDQASEKAVRKRYSSDLPGQDWQRLEPLLAVRRQSKWPTAEVVNAILCALKNGCVWRDLPGDFPPWGTAYWYFAKWEADGTWQRVSTWQPGMSRKKASPTAVTLDTQSVKNGATATGATVGFDAGKLVKGRKRLVLTDTLDHVLASRMLPANVVNGPAAIAFWDEVAAARAFLGQVQVVLADSSFNEVFRAHLARRYGIRIEKPATYWSKNRISAFMPGAGLSNVASAG